jgi:hypothetical protein
METGNNGTIEDDRRAFYSYGPAWEHTYFDEVTGGFLVTNLARKYRPMSKIEREIFKKEQEMGVKYASFGFQIEHLYEISGISSPDIGIRRHGPHLMVNRRTADFKRLSSSNNIYNEGKDARFKKGAELVMYEFTGHFSGISRELERLSDRRIHGYYYFSGENQYYIF